MRYVFQYRRYRLPFRAPVRTAHGPWSEREGIIVRLQNETGAVGLGEAAVIPWFGSETAAEAEAACRSLGKMVDDEWAASLPPNAVCVRNAIAAALAEIQAQVPVAPERDAESFGARGRPSASYIGVAAWLSAGAGALTEIPPKAEAGFRVFKWKVGVGDIANELALLDDVCAKLPGGSKLRLDANGAWDRRKAERWLERCAERPVEFVEQPIAATARAAGDTLLGLAGDFPTPIALDESLVGEGDVERWIGLGWPGIFVVKPALFGDVQRALVRLAHVEADVVFSSALETAVGARTALRVAFSWRVDSAGRNQAKSKVSAAAGKPTPENELEPARRALGFGVWPLFADSRFDGPALAPFIRREDVERIDADAVWKALG
jgi:O-succinylbenzoate synthase